MVKHDTYYQNPIISIDFADPSVLSASDGQYYLYGTRSYQPGNTTKIQIARSDNLVNWQFLPDALTEKPQWAQKTIEFWAPHVIEDSGNFFLYFSTERDSGVGMAIGVARSKTPYGPFHDSGSPLLSGKSFTVIDPMAFDDPMSGKKFLYWGSGHGPICVSELLQDRLRIRSTNAPLALLYPNSIYPFERLIEGAYVLYRNKYYYLFYSGDNCWEKNSYATMIARSSSPTGPFIRRAEALNQADSVILHSNKVWDSPGQNSIIEDKKGNYWMVYHAVNQRHRFNPGTSIVKRVTLMDELHFDSNDWPILSTNSPSHTKINIPYTAT